MAASNSTPLKSFTQLFQASVEAYKKYFKQIAVLAAISAAIWLPAEFLPEGEYLLLVFILTALYALTSLLITIAVFYLVDDRQPDKSVTNVLKLSLVKFVPVVLASILVTLAVIGGFILLIIPGIIFSVWFVFTQQVVVFENTRPVQALGQSRAYVRGRWWGVFGRMLLLILLILGASLFVSILTAPAQATAPYIAVVVNNLFSFFVAAPIATIFTYHLYRSAVETYSA